MTSPPVTREELEEREEQQLASYAMRCRQSQGRTHDEPEHAYRTTYMRDRDRIIHAAAFRRLEYKTQVFVTHAGDYYRTRLTHTMEVAQISRTAARALRLNEDLTESIALLAELIDPGRIVGGDVDRLRDQALNFLLVGFHYALTV